MTGPLLEPGVLPAPLRDGRRLRRVAAALVVLCVGWLAVDAAVSYATRPRIGVERSTVRSPGSMPPDGPPAGTFARDWRRPVPSGQELGPATFLVGAHVVALTSDRAGAYDRLRAYDARSGEPSWHYREPGRTIAGLAATDGAIVVETNGDLGGRLVGLDAATGRRLWESPGDWRLTQGGDESTSSDMLGDAAAGIVPVVAADEPERLGVDARTGVKRWKSRLYRRFHEDCAPTRDPVKARGTRSGAVLLAVPSSDTAGEPAPCGVVTLDAATGETLWTRPLPFGVTATAASGAVLMETGGSRAMDWEDGRPTVLGRDGRPLFRLGPGGCVGGCRLFAAAGRVVLQYEARSEPRLAVIDLRDGRTRTHAVPSGHSSDEVSFASDGARVYAHADVLASDTEVGGTAPLPAGLAIFDVARNTWELSPLTYTQQLPDAEGTPRADPVLFGVAGGRLFTVTPPAQLGEPWTLSSHVSTGTRAPTELGGVPARDWPDACALLRSVRLEDWEARADEPDPPLRIGRSTVARPSCARGETEVHVLWVAATAREADALLDGAASEIGADEEYTHGRSDNRRIVRVGRTIVLVRDYETRESTVRAVVRELRR